jgi:hypothetical protein
MSTSLPEGLNRVPVRDSEWPVYWIVDTDLNVVGQTGRNGVDLYFATAATADAFASGSYEPEHSATGADIVTDYEGHYVRVGDIVTVSGTVNVEVTAETVLILVPLPIESNLTATSDLSGAAGVHILEDEGDGTYVSAHVTGDISGSALVGFQCTEADVLAEAHALVSYTFAYKVVPIEA